MSNAQLLVNWSFYPSGEDYRYILQLARNQGIKTNLREVKREVKDRLREQKFIPVGKRMSDADYQALKPVWRIWWFNDELI